MRGEKNEREWRSACELNRRSLRRRTASGDGYVNETYDDTAVAANGTSAMLAAAATPTTTTTTTPTPPPPPPPPTPTPTALPINSPFSETPTHSKSTRDPSEASRTG